MTKRIISMLLILTLLISTVPTAAFAETPTTGDQSSVDTGEVTLEGTNSFGTLLTEDITEQQEQLEEAAQSGYTVTDLVIEDDTAIVTYDTLEEATLVVALYTEDGMQLLTSGTTTVLPEETTAFVTFEGEMPQYFMASAYLLDNYDFSPLCPAYDTPMYTKEMQDLLASTMDDYDPELVLNLDDDKTTNFAVYAEGTKVIQPAEDVNTVVTVDDTTLTYVIENADTQITGLQPGDVFAYSYEDDQLLIVKVANISVEGATATITGAELEMSDAFSHVKVEGYGASEDMLVDDSIAAEGITYVGTCQEEASPVATFALENSAGPRISHEFKVDCDLKDESENLDIKVSVKGSLKLSVDVGVHYFLSLFRQYVEFKADLSAVAGIYIEGKIAAKLPLGYVGIAVVPGVYVGFEPKLMLEFTGTINLTATLSMCLGMKYDDKTGAQNISTYPKFVPDYKVQGKLFLGLDLCPTVKILDDDIAEFELNATVGVEVTARARGKLYDIELDKDPGSIHECTECLEIKPVFKASLGGKISFLDKDWLTVPFTIGNLSIPLVDMYYSLDNDEFGIGKCPNTTYRVVLEIKNSSGLKVEGAQIATNTGEVWGTTNGSGILVKYLPKGGYVLVVTHDDDKYSDVISVTDACKMTVIFEQSISNNTSPNGTSTKISILDGVDSNIFLDISAKYSDVDIGDYITLGTYKGEPILWRCVAIDENGPLMLSDKILCYKAFDASGESNAYHGDGWGYIRRRYGSNCWSDSSIRQWLNSSDSIVTYSHCPPKSGFVTCNPYADEAGFLNGFSSAELALIKTVSLVVNVNEWETHRTGYCDGGTAELNWSPSKTEIDYSNYYYQTVTDRIFFLNSYQADNVYQNFTDYFLNSGYTDTAAQNNSEASTSAYWLNIPCNTGASYENVRTMKGYEYAGTAYDGSIGVRPAFYLNAKNKTASPTETQSTGVAVDEKVIIEGNTSFEAQHLNAIYGGSYIANAANGYSLKNATFQKLVPGKEYVLLSIISTESEDVLGDDNLLYIDQSTAKEDGTLEFQYAQRVDRDLAYVMLCGASNKDLADAVISFPDMVPNGDTQVVDPEVVYDGETLEEGRDYVILGDVDFTDAGTYTCYIRGIYQYAGLVECTYHVMVVPTLELSYPTLSFEDEIFYNVYYTVSDTASVVEMGLMVLPSRDDSATIDDAISVVPGYITNGTVYLAKSEGVGAANMGDALYFKVYAKLTDGSYAYSTAGGYNAKAYANSILSSNNSDEMKSLVVSMLNYGAQAQLYFGHNTDKLVNNALTTEQQTLVAAYDSSMMDAIVKADTAKTADFVRINSNFKQLYPSVSFDSAFAINFYCQSAITVDSGMTLYYWDMATMEAVDKLSLDNATGSMEMVATGDVYWGQVPGIAAKDMDKTYYVTCVFESGGETITTGIIPYTLGKYCTTKADTDGDALQAFAQATAVYGYYAKQYFASIA